jgi:hypothetical protein
VFTLLVLPSISIRIETISTRPNMIAYIEYKRGMMYAMEILVSLGIENNRKKYIF